MDPILKKAGNILEQNVNPKFAFGKIFQIGLYALFLALFLSCSISVENPEADARKKVDQIIPTTFAAIEGRWKPDSTYTVDDDKATHLGNAELDMEFFRDSSFILSDQSKKIFPDYTRGKFLLKGDTLIFAPILKNATLPLDTFIIRVRFLGNRLELVHPADQRFSFFHRRKGLDSLAQDTLLNDSLWLLTEQRYAIDSTYKESQAHDYTYLRFTRGKMFWDKHRNGIFSTDSGALTKTGNRWIWEKNGSDPKNGTGSKNDFLVDMLQDDSLRLWPMNGNNIDSGYQLFIRRGKKHPFDINLYPLFGHLRSDSSDAGGPSILNHYGRYFDLIFDTNHVLTTESNMPTMPIFKSWKIDSGKIYGLDTAGKFTRFTLDTIINKEIKLTTSVNAYFGSVTHLNFTQVDATSFPANSLARFDQASYFHINIAAEKDTLRYYFNVNYDKTILDDFEIMSKDSSRVYWLAIRINPSLDAFQSSQPNFRFALEGYSQNLGRFRCHAIPSKDLVIRAITSSDPKMAQGLIQGKCQILSSEKTPVDSTLTLEGSYKLLRKKVSAKQSDLWSLP